MVGDTDTQPVVVLLNGLVQRSYQWESCQKTLDNKGFSSVAFNFPGQGSSIGSRFDGSLDDLVDITHAVIERIGLRRVHLCGLSAGGVVALRYAARYPERLKSLISISGFSRKDPLMTALHKALLDALCVGGISRMFDLLVTVNFRSQWIKKNALIVELSKKLCIQDNNIPTVEGLLRAILEFDDFTAGLKNFPGPTLLLGGESDPIVPRWSQEAIREQLPNSIYYVVREASHALTMEQPELTMSLLTDFLRDVENGSWASDSMPIFVRAAGNSIDKIRCRRAYTEEAA
jgi:pimeloyl-ACP methyl ester carboxylesterase